MRILIADDHELYLKGLEFVLDNFDADMQFVTAHNYVEIFEILKQDRAFDLILTDLAMPGGKWLDSIKKIHEYAPETPIIVLSAVFDREIVQQTIETGVSGYISKTSSNATLIDAIHLVLSGGVYIPEELLSDMPSSDAVDQLKSENKKNLTPRQIDVLKLIAKGEANKQIAYELGLSEGTVKLHITAILKILNVYNRTGAVIEATKQGIITQNDLNV
ncbi:MAG: response regulator transcription factor [Pseudomonadota bacterium]|nr:response regulator transcription factor [Pseudomonadota bacterium]